MMSQWRLNSFLTDCGRLFLFMEWSAAAFVAFSTFILSRSDKRRLNSHLIVSKSKNCLPFFATITSVLHTGNARLRFTFSQVIGALPNSMELDNGHFRNFDGGTSILSPAFRQLHQLLFLSLIFFLRISKWNKYVMERWESAFHHHHYFNW